MTTCPTWCVADHTTGTPTHTSTPAALADGTRVGVLASTYETHTYLRVTIYTPQGELETVLPGCAAALGRLLAERGLDRELGATLIAAAAIALAAT